MNTINRTAFRRNEGRSKLAKAINTPCCWCHKTIAPTVDAYYVNTTKSATQAGASFWYYHHHCYLALLLQNLLHTRGKGCQCEHVRATAPDGRCDECTAREGIKNAYAA
jgi:hypothetical protein